MIRYGIILRGGEFLERSKVIKDISTWYKEHGLKLYYDWAFGNTHLSYLKRTLRYDWNDSYLLECDKEYEKFVPLMVELGFHIIYVTLKPTEQNKKDFAHHRIHMEPDGDVIRKLLDYDKKRKKNGNKSISKSSGENLHSQDEEVAEPISEDALDAYYGTGDGGRDGIGYSQESDLL